MPTKQQYRLNNLSCANCAAIFERNVRNIATVEDVQLNFGAAKITIVGDVTKEQLDAAGAFDGITASPVNERRVKKTKPFYKRRENIVAVIALFFIIVAMTFEKTTMTSDRVIASLFFVAIIIGGISIFKVGFQNLLKLQFDMKTLMTIAVIGAAIIGEWEEAAIVVFLFAVSEALESYSMNKARQSIEKLMDLSPNTAIIKRANGEEEVLTEHVAIGDLLVVKPGQKIAMDGIIVEGRSTVNQATITGEPLAVLKAVGDDVFAGTLNEQGAMLVEVTKRVEDTTLAKIIYLVEEAQAEKAPSQQFVDRFAKYYTPLIMLVALLVAIVPPIFIGDWQHWIYQGLAVLVVGCPCALVISTPVAIVTAIGNAARQGVLIKGGAYLESLAHIRAIAFDKTGTLTKGEPEVTFILPADGVTEEYLLQVTAAVEKYSQHPLAQAVLKRAISLRHKNATDFQSVIGRGAYAQVDGETIYVGSLSWIQSLVTIEAHYIEQMNARNQSIIAVATVDRFLGAMTVADEIREESATIIREINEAGVPHTIMLTGDSQQTAEVIAASIGIGDVRAQLLPEHKLQALNELQQQYEYVAMVGDGVNDAPALAKASVGIAMGGAGTDVALETADIALMSDDLSKLPATIRLSKKTLTIIKQNIIFALGLKLFALLLVIPGWLTLWIAIFADIGATLLVVLNSLRLMANIVKK